MRRPHRQRISGWVGKPPEYSHSGDTGQTAHAPGPRAFPARGHRFPGSGQCRVPGIASREGRGGALPGGVRAPGTAPAAVPGGGAWRSGHRGTESQETRRALSVIVTGARPAITDTTIWPGRPTAAWLSTPRGPWDEAFRPPPGRYLHDPREHALLVAGRLAKGTHPQSGRRSSRQAAGRQAQPHASP